MNALSIDETAWSTVMSKKRSWSIKGQSNRLQENSGGKMITLLAATSCLGVELFMLIEGGVDRLVWSYFIAELQKKVFPKMYSRVPGLTQDDIVLLYDNCPCHVSKFGGWWMRNLRCYKLTTPPYTPEVTFFSLF